MTVKKGKAGKGRRPSRGDSAGEEGPAPQRETVSAEVRCGRYASRVTCVATWAMCAWLVQCLVPPNTQSSLQRGSCWLARFAVHASSQLAPAYGSCRLLCGSWAVTLCAVEVKLLLHASLGQLLFSRMQAPPSTDAALSTAAAG